jgi:zinc protease
MNKQKIICTIHPTKIEGLLMKYRAIHFILLLFLELSMSKGYSQKFFPYEYEKFQLDNGFKVYLIPVKGSGLAAYYSIVRTGSRDEYEAGRSGFAHFFEHMMFRGTKRFPGPLYDKMMTEMGADANAFTSDDLTVYHLVIPSIYLEKVMDLESDRFMNLSYGETEFKTEAGAVYGEYRKSRVNPYSVLLEELQNLAFDVHTYKHTTMGFEADIKNMPNLFEHSRNFFNRYYRPENVVLMIVGDIETESIKALTKKYYSHWQPGYFPPDIQAEPPQNETRFKEVKYEGKTLPIIWIAYKGDAFNPADPLLVAGYLLGDLAFGENSDLYKKLVIDEQKVQFLANWFPLTRDPKLLNIYSMVKNKKDISYVQDEIKHTTEKFKNELVDAQRLNGIKKRVRYTFLMNLDTPDNIAGSLSRFVALTGGLEHLDVYYQQVDAVTSDDILAAARRYFQTDRQTTILLKGETE